MGSLGMPISWRVAVDFQWSCIWGEVRRRGEGGEEAGGERRGEEE